MTKDETTREEIAQEIEADMRRLFATAQSAEERAWLSVAMRRAAQVARRGR